MQITQEQSTELMELLEDTIAYYCDENLISGETVWTVAECISQTKVAQIQGEVI